MWLISTRRAELRFFPTPESVPGGYAILSHCWGNNEQTFQDVERHMARCVKTGENPRDFVSKKIRRFCILAELQGYDWGWSDTCCIDKTSSSELSEAINSMFRYYSLAGVCYAFLHDVPTDCALWTPSSEFWKSRWHTRGWTLQELIAPEKVLFLSKDWEPLDTKHGLAELLEEITSVPQGVLTSMKTELPKTCIASRLSWAADRQTTRQEDEAYCLLGILNVDMYTSYGEGRRAFYRLQEELIKRSTDTSLFAWGEPILSMSYMRNFINNSPSPHSDHTLESFILGSSPSAFNSQVGHRVTFTASHPVIPGPKWSWSSDIPRNLSFSVTPHGIRACFPVVELQPEGLAIAWLPSCTVDGRYVGLILNPCSDTDSLTPLGPVYDTSGISLPGPSPVRLRLLCFTLEDLDRDLFKGTTFDFQWQDIYIRTRPHDPVSSEALWLERTDVAATLPFCTLPDRLRSKYDVRRVMQSEQDASGRSETYMFYSRSAATRARDPFLVHLGLCMRGKGLPRQLWSRASPAPGTPQSEWKKIIHDCDADHAVNWASGYQKTFQITFSGASTSHSVTKSIQLTFTRPSDKALSTTPVGSNRNDETRPWDLDLEVDPVDLTSSTAQAWDPGLVPSEPRAVKMTSESPASKPPRTVTDTATGGRTDSSSAPHISFATMPEASSSRVEAPARTTQPPPLATQATSTSPATALQPSYMDAPPSATRTSETSGATHAPSIAITASPVRAIQTPPPPTRAPPNLSTRASPPTSLAPPETTEALYESTDTSQETSPSQIDSCLDAGMAAHAVTGTAARTGTLAALSGSSLGAPALDKGPERSANLLVDTITGGEGFTLEPDDIPMELDDVPDRAASSSGSAAVRDVDVDLDSEHGGRASADVDVSERDEDDATRRPTGGKRKQRGVPSERPPKRGKGLKGGALEPEGSSGTASRRSSRSNQPPSGSPRKTRGQAAQHETPAGDAPGTKRQTRSRRGTKA